MLLYNTDTDRRVFIVILSVTVAKYLIKALDICKNLFCNSKDRPTYGRRASQVAYL